MNSLSRITRRSLCAAGTIALCLGANAQQATPDGWPLVFTSEGDQVQVFKPQPESFDGTSFTARAAVALQRPGDSTPVFGAIWGNGTLAVDRGNRMGKLTTFKVTDARFPGITDANEINGLKDMLSREIPAHSALIPIDWLVAALDEEKQSTASYDNAPPTVIYREKPSILVYIDGAPIFRPVQDNESDPVYKSAGPELDRVVNTPFLLVRKDNRLWLHGSGLWYSSTAINGPWTNEAKAPDDLQELARQVDTSQTTAPAANAVIPDVVVTTKPAVLVDLNGQPRMQPFDGTSLMYVTNTDKDLFLYIPTQEYYLLASGRWYGAKDLKNGPWRFIPSDELPADFAKVPEGSSKDGILAHVAGTEAAREAVRDASIPQTAKVDRSTASVTVSYDGDPQFRQITGTDVYAAENASTTVLRINGVYHVCDNAVWYEGNTPDGPWTVSTSVPPEVQQIPPSDPDYRVRYVYIYDSTPDNVFVGYTPGYLGSYVQGGTVIYGTGYYYDPWPSFWYPRPFTWGFNMYYSPWYGWGFAPTWGYTWFYPNWSHYGYGMHFHHDWGWWGPYAYCPQVNWHARGYYGHRPSLHGRAGSRQGTMVGGRRAADLYSNHRTAGITPSRVERNAETRMRTNTTTQRNGRKTARPITGDHFTDNKGNVYRNDGARTEEYRQGRWAPVQQRPATGTTQQTNRHAAPNSAFPSTGKQHQAVPQNTRRNHNARTFQQAPHQIRQERTRGEQRVNEFRGYQQQRMQQPARTPPSHSIQRSAPSPQRQSAPSHGGGKRSGGRR